MHTPSATGQLRALAIALLDEFAAGIAQKAVDADRHLPADFFGWVADEGTRLVESTVLQRFEQGAQAPAHPSPDLVAALRCGVRYWVAPGMAARFEALRPLFPELPVHAAGREVTMLVRTGQWRCPSGNGCPWKLCKG